MSVRITNVLFLLLIFSSIQFLVYLNIHTTSEVSLSFIAQLGMPDNHEIDVTLHQIGAGANQSDLILLKVKSEEGQELLYNMNKGAQMSEIMNDYCTRQMLNSSTVVFLVDGRIIRPESTPNELQLEDGDQIDAMLHQMGGVGIYRRFNVTISANNRGRLPISLSICRKYLFSRNLPNPIVINLKYRNAEGILDHDASEIISQTNYHPGRKNVIFNIGWHQFVQDKNFQKGDVISFIVKSSGKERNATTRGLLRGSPILRLLSAKHA